MTSVSNRFGATYWTVTATCVVCLSEPEVSVPVTVTVKFSGGGGVELPPPQPTCAVNRIKAIPNRGRKPPRRNFSLRGTPLNPANARNGSSAP